MSWKKPTESVLYGKYLEVEMHKASFNGILLSLTPSLAKTFIGESFYGFINSIHWFSVSENVSGISKFHFMYILNILLTQIVNLCNQAEDVPLLAPSLIGNCRLRPIGNVSFQPFQILSVICIVTSAQKCICFTFSNIPCLKINIPW